MSEPNEQEKSLSRHVVHRLHLEEQLPDERVNRYSFAIKCCGCTAAVLLIAATIILVLMFTEFRIKDPVLRLNAVALRGLDLLISPEPGVNLTLEADVSLKNPNLASFMFSNTTMFVYYDGSLLGEGRAPAGKAGARRTVGWNMTIDLTTVGRIPGAGRLKGDLDGGILPISIYTRINGMVKISAVVKRHLVVSMNCTMNVNVRKRQIQDTGCRKKVSL